jgi:hypothetical protein
MGSSSDLDLHLSGAPRAPFFFHCCAIIVGDYIDKFLKSLARIDLNHSRKARNWST